MAELKPSPKWEKFSNILLQAKSDEWARSPVTLIFFLYVARKQMALFKCFWLRKNKRGREIFTFFYLPKIESFIRSQKAIFISPYWSKQAFVTEKPLSDLHVAQLVGSFPPGNKHTIDKPSSTSLKQEKRLFHPTPSDKNVIHVGANTSGMDWLKWLFRGFLVGQWIFFYVLGT